MSTSKHPGADTESLKDDRPPTSHSQVASSPHAKQPPPKATSTELPKEPEHIHHAFDRKREEEIPAGNREYELQLREEERLSLYISRANFVQPPVYCDLVRINYNDGIELTLRSVLYRLIRLKGYIEHGDIATRVAETAATLTNGCAIMTYLKLRYLHKLDPVQLEKFLRRPKVAEDTEVPVPFAYAISQLGVVKVSSQPTVYRCAPTLSAEDAKAMLLRTNQTWSSTIYAQAVEYAKSLGMRFTTVNLTETIGSAWWLYEQDIDDDIFRLLCTLPEDNFSVQTAVLHSMWCINELGGFANAFVDLSSLPTQRYGVMARNLRSGINVSTYFAIEEEKPEVWRVV